MSHELMYASYELMHMSHEPMTANVDEYMGHTMCSFVNKCHGQTHVTCSRHGSFARYYEESRTNVDGSQMNTTNSRHEQISRITDMAQSPRTMGSHEVMSINHELMHLRN